MTNHSVQAELAEMVNLAERYNLPRPPVTAPLVLGTAAWTSDEGDLVPLMYRPVFQLEKVAGGTARVLMGWRVRVVHTLADFQPPTGDHSLNSPVRNLQGNLSLRCDMLTVVAAVQLAQRNELVEASSFWQGIRDHNVESTRCR